MQTEAQLCNVALARVGQRQLIDSLTEDTAGAKLCAAAYPNARDVVLAGHPWPFCTRPAFLAELAETRPGHAHVYALPADCLEPQYLFSGVRPGQTTATLSNCAWLPWVSACFGAGVGLGMPVEFAIEAKADGSGSVLVTDQEDAQLIYTAAVTQVPAFPALVADAIAWRLAQDLALSLAVKPQLAFAVDQKADAALRKAQAQAANAQQADPRPVSKFISARR